MSEHLPRFKSGFERGVAAALEALNASFTYESLILPYIEYHEYHPDFVIRTKSGKTIVVEAKGRFWPGAKQKMEAVKKSYPEKDIRFVFQDASLPIRKGAKMTYGQWADKHGFPWAEGKVPESWLIE